MARKGLRWLVVAMGQAAVVAAATACVPDATRWETDRRSEAPVAPDARLTFSAAGEPIFVPAWNAPAEPVGTSVCAGTLSAVRARGDTAFAAWWAPRADSTALIVVARSDDGGRNWRPPTVADSTDRGRTGCRRTPPYIGADSLNGYVHVAYFMAASEGAGVFFMHSMDGGATFHAPVPVVYGERPSVAAIASYGDTVAVAYQDPNASVPQIWLALSRSSGHIFEQRSSVSATTANATRPAVALRGNRIAIAWYETERGGGGGATIVRPGSLHW